MPGRNVSRRLFVGVMGGGVLAAPVLASALPGSKAEKNLVSPRSTPISMDDRAEAEARDRENVEKLFHPLRPGSRLARWTIARIDPVVDGCVRVEAQTDDGHKFGLELLARDRETLSQRPPAETDRYAIFVANGGDGWSPTHEEHGLAAMTLAMIVAKNERDVSLSGLLTHGERIRKHGDRLLVVNPDPGSAD